MEGIPLLSGAYQAKSVIASAQRCVNLYLESNPSGVRSPMPTTHYPRPGKITRWLPIVPGAGRGLYAASDGSLYAVVNDTVYFITSTYNTRTVGNIAPGTTPVSMADNGITGAAQIALVDGSATGYQINMKTFVMTPIVDGTGLFTGADIVVYLGPYFIFNTVPNSQNFIVTLPNSLTFDVLDIAAKATYADNLIALGIRSKELWLFGDKSSTEPWSLSGAVDFAFQGMPSTFIPYGSAAKFGTIFADTSLYWISINQQGQAIFCRTDGYNPKRISTHPIEFEVQNYALISDAIAQAFQIEGHTFILWHFPTANKTLVFDQATDQWAQWAYSDANGLLQRDKACFYASAYGKNFAQDWATGQVYEINGNVYDDDGHEITFIRSFPVVQKDLNRLTHNALRAYMEFGTAPDPNAAPPVLLLFTSDDGGKVWHDPIELPLGSRGEYSTVAQATRLGQARNRVYELVWSANVKTALNGVFIDVEEDES